MGDCLTPTHREGYTDATKSTVYRIGYIANQYCCRSLYLGVNAMKPLYKHDCDKCEFIGSLATGSDIYLHVYPSEYEPVTLTIIERFSDDGPDYISFTGQPGDWVSLKRLRPSYLLGLAIHQKALEERAQ